MDDTKQRYVHSALVLSVAITDFNQRYRSFQLDLYASFIVVHILLTNSFGQDDRLMQVLEGHGQRITAVAVHEASNVCVSGDYGGQICVWNLSMTRSSSAPVTTWQEHDDWRYSGVASLVVSSDQVLYSGSGDRTIKAWSLVVINKFYCHMASQSIFTDPDLPVL